MSDDKPALGPSTGGAPGDGETNDTVADPGAVAIRPMRPTGKRSRRAAAEPAEDTTEASGISGSDDSGDAEADDKPAKRKKTAKAAKSEGSRVNPFLFVWTYLQQVVSELRKVIWPNRKQMVTYTTVVLVFLAFMVTLIGLTDLGLAKLVSIIFG